MKRPLAYITAAWCGIPEVDTDLAVEFCRAAYEAGLAPICPKLYLPLILNDSVPEEHKDGIDMGRDTQAMQKYSEKVLHKGKEQPSILGQLRKFTELIKAKPKEKQRTREAVKDGR